MRIYFERSGGFMGLRLVQTLDTAVLPEKEAQDLQEMISAASFFELPEQLSAPVLGVDQYQYKVVIEQAEQRHVVETTETTCPAELRPLLRRLTVLARLQQRQKSDQSRAGKPE